MSCHKACKDNEQGLEDQPILSDWTRTDRR